MEKDTLRAIEIIKNALEVIGREQIEENSITGFRLTNELKELDKIINDNKEQQ